MSNNNRGLIKHVRLTKLETLAGGQLDPNGAAIGGVISPGYTVKGFCANLPAPNTPFKVFRYERNGESVAGVMTTSAVVSVSEIPEGIQFKTMNSIYRLEILSNYE